MDDLSLERRYRKHVGAMTMTTIIKVQIGQEKVSGSRVRQVGGSLRHQVSFILFK